jgi:probable rRNA maturation factor
VLSFDQNFYDPETNRLYLGDIIISLERALVQADEQDLSLDQECAYLAIHGTLHLLGYDHDRTDEEKEMFQIQDRLFNQIMNEMQE